MKKLLLTITFFYTIFAGISQQLLTENFNSLTVGDFSTGTVAYATANTAQNGWTLYSFMATPSNSNFQIEDVATSDNRFSYSGSALPASTSSPTENIYAQKAINWSSRTVGNDFVVAECVFNTGATTTSKNEFLFGIYNSNRLKTISAFKYIRDTKVLSGVAYDSTGTSSYGNYSYSTIGTGNTSLVLQDDTDYILRLIYDVNTGTTTWYAALSSSSSTPICYTYAVNFPVSDIGLCVLTARAGTSNASSSSVQFDDLSVEARPCAAYLTVANSDFSYTGTTHCIGSANLTPVLVDGNATGTFTSTPAGLVINATTGVVDLGLSASVAGTYTVKFVADNACVDSTEISITILDCAEIDEVEKTTFTIYPNPANDALIVSDLNIESGIIQLLTAEGKLIESREFNHSANESFDVKSLNAGIYFIQIGTTVQKIVIQ